MAGTGSRSERPPTVNGVPIDYAADVGSLVAQLKPPGPAAWAACIALGHKSSSDAMEALLGLADDHDWRYRRTAIEAIAAHPLALMAGERIVRALSDNSPYVVRTACDVSARLRLTRAHDAIHNLLASADAATRRAAVSALSTLWRPSDADALLRILSKDKDIATRREAAWTLRRNADHTNWRRLFEAFVNDPLPRHRLFACQLVAEFGDDSSVRRIRPLLRDRDGHVRKAASRVTQGRGAAG